MFCISRLLVKNGTLQYVDAFWELISYSQGQTELQRWNSSITSCGVRSWQLQNCSVKTTADIVNYLSKIFHYIVIRYYI